MSPRLSEGREPGDLDRYDMTGKDLTRWREGRAAEFKAKVKALFARLRAHKAEGDDKTLEQHARSIPRKLIDCGDAKLTEPDTRRQLAQAQTEQAFADAELARMDRQLRAQQIENARLDGEGKKLDNLAKKLDLIERLREIVGDKPMPEVLDMDGEEVIAFLGRSTAKLERREPERADEAEGSG